MYNIRRADEADYAAIAAMTKKFYATTDWAHLPIDDESLNGLIVLCDCRGALLVAEADDASIVGMLAGTYNVLPTNLNIEVFKEHAFWVEPEHRNSGAGLQLFQALDSALEEDEVGISIMVSLKNSPEIVEKGYVAAGYTLAEKMWVKEMKWH